MRMPLDYSEQGRLIIKKHPVNKVFETINTVKETITQNTTWYIFLLVVCLVKFNLDTYWGVTLILGTIVMGIITILKQPIIIKYFLKSDKIKK